jgi:hypothetical protein
LNERRDLTSQTCVAIVTRYVRRPLPKKRSGHLAKKKVVRRAWTKDDVRTLKSMAKAKTGVKRIAKALKRSPGATTVKAAKLGISLSMT